MKKILLSLFMTSIALASGYTTWHYFPGKVDFINSYPEESCVFSMYEPLTQEEIEELKNDSTEIVYESKYNITHCARLTYDMSYHSLKNGKAKTDGHSYNRFLNRITFTRTVFDRISFGFTLPYNYGWDSEYFKRYGFDEIFFRLSTRVYKADFLALHIIIRMPLASIFENDKSALRFLSGYSSEDTDFGFILETQKNYYKHSLNFSAGYINLGNFEKYTTEGDNSDETENIGDTFCGKAQYSYKLNNGSIFGTNMSFDYCLPTKITYWNYYDYGDEDTLDDDGYSFKLGAFAKFPIIENKLDININCSYDLLVENSNRNYDILIGFVYNKYYKIYR